MRSAASMLAVVLYLLTAGTASPAATAAQAASVQAVGTAERAAQAREASVRFYDALERLLRAHGADHTRWPEGEDKHLIAAYLDKKDALTLNNCVFGRNLLGLGMGETPADAEEALHRGAKDAWGNPYTHILAGASRVPKPFQLIFAIAGHRGLPLYNRDISKKVYVFLKADLHSQFADIFKNFNGRSVLVMAREVHILGAPASADPSYPEELGPALCAADSLSATVYIGEKDRVPRIMPRAMQDIAFALFGIEPDQAGGNSRAGETCPYKAPVKVIRLPACGHEIPEYYPGMSEHGTCLLQKERPPPEK